ncbi:MAG: type II secretion system F family protein [Gammaproteobacteria bacterium]|nr:MAG: type II secretion system F family protein [Gammaproteobacteria bacterium]
MPEFQYKGRSSRGDLMTGVIDAPSIDAVATQLLNSNIVPIDIAARVAGDNPFQALQDWLNTRSPTLTDLILFSRQMHSLMRAGVPIIRAMTGIIEATKNLRLKRVFRDVQTQIESGRELSSAFARYPEIFTPLYISMIRVGEGTGNLDAAFLRISEYLELEKDTRERVKSALRYPAMVIVAMGVALTIINLVVIPAFAKVFERAHAELPIYTRILVATSNFFVDYWLLMGIGLVLSITGLSYYVKTERGRYTWGKYKLRLPLVGDILLRATLGRFSRAFAMSLAAGVPLVQALTVVARAVDNDYVGDHIFNMRNGIERGESITRTAAATNMFTPLVLQMLFVGEETGQVDEMMEEVAGFYEREVDYDIKNLSGTIEPVMIVIIGGMVLVLALGVFLPMWDLASVSMRNQ